MGFRSHKKIPFTVKKRHLILLEVLIAFALVVLCVLPMIYPQVFILKSERQFVDTIELDHTVNLLYANILQKLYLNEIGWDDIQEHKRAEISDSMLREIGVEHDITFKGSYAFSIEKRKPPQPEDKLYLVNLTFYFTPKNERTKAKTDSDMPSAKPKELKYEYQVFIERRPKRTKDGEVKEQEVQEEQVQVEKAKEAKP